MKIFHHSDYDGRCAAFLVYGKLGTYKENFYEMDYKKEFPLHIIEKNEEVWILDYSIPPKLMAELLDITPNVIWIEHHISAIEKWDNYVKEYGLSYNIAGVRKNGTAACELTYMYLYPGEKIPMFVDLIGDYDVWTWRYGDTTRYFNAGLGSINTKIDSLYWIKLMEEKEDYELMYLNIIIDRGKVVCDYKTIRNKTIRDAISFETFWEGHLWIAANQAIEGSGFFGDHPIKNYILFSFDGEKWRVSLRSNDIDVRKIAEKYGGGGHKGAAGFICKELPFKKKGLEE
jgi:oligoribonuclease NrnB/cAMP/cGMP phosphodiesterase (DHH superfamily)